MNQQSPPFCKTCKNRMIPINDHFASDCLIVHLKDRLRKGHLISLMSTKAMHSVNIIEYLIKNRVGTKFLQKLSFDYNAIISTYSNMAKINLFCALRNKTKLITKIIVFLAVVLYFEFCIYFRICFAKFLWVQKHCLFSGSNLIKKIGLIRLSRNTKMRLFSGNKKSCLPN